jgi:hypothetical protein
MSHLETTKISQERTLYFPMERKRTNKEGGSDHLACKPHLLGLPEGSSPGEHTLLQLQSDVLD